MMGGQGEKRRPGRYRLYDKIPLTLKAMDRIIVCIVAAIALVLVIGLFVWR